MPEGFIVEEYRVRIIEEGDIYYCEYGVFTGDDEYDVYYRHPRVFNTYERALRFSTICIREMQRELAVIDAKLKRREHRKYRRIR